MFTLADILEPLTGRRHDNAVMVLSDAVTDSRQAIPASLFVAIPGERVDGHDYVSSAFRNGATVAIVQKDIDPTITVLDIRGSLPAVLNIPAAPFASGSMTPLPVCKRSPVIGAAS